MLTEREQRYVGRHVERMAGRWAAKEAISKVLGLGVRGVGWREIEVLPNPAGAPQVFLHGRADARARAMDLDDVTVSIIPVVLGAGAPLAPNIGHDVPLELTSHRAFPSGLVQLVYRVKA